MEQIAKQLLKRISDKAETLTSNKITKVSHSENNQEWRAYISQSNPHWEDISWRVKEPNKKGDSEVHLGFYSEIPSDQLTNAIKKTEKLGERIVDQIIKNDNGIRLVWKVNLNDNSALEKVEVAILKLLPDFLKNAFEVIIKKHEINYNEFDDMSKAYIENVPLNAKYTKKMEIQTLRPNQLNSIHFAELIGSVKVISFHLDNTVDAIDEKGGDERFKLTFDIENQMLQAMTVDSSMNENKMLYYTGSPYVQFYDEYINNEYSEYHGYFMITNADNWEIPFHGQLEEVSYGRIDEEIYLRLKETINSKSVFNFFHDVKSFLNS